MDGVRRGLPGYVQDDNADAFGYWLCTLCDSQFYDGPRAVHAEGCPDAAMPCDCFDETYRNCIRVRNLTHP